jgi:hypothetical protein
MTEYAKYHVKVSQIAALLGMWGVQRQVYELSQLTRFKQPNKSDADAVKLESLFKKASTIEFQEEIGELQCEAEAAIPEVLHNRETLLRAIARKAACAYGSNGERAFIEIYNSCAPHERRIHSRQHEVFQRFQHGNVPWVINGRIDGIQGESVVEIKHRTECLSDAIPDYEQVQMQTYMALCRLPSARWIQCVRKRAFYCQEWRDVQWCDQYWTSVFAKLERVIAFAEKLTASDVALDAFMSCGEQHQTRILAVHVT